MFSQFDRSGAWTSGIGIKQDKAVKKSSLLTNFKSINVSVSVCLTLNFFVQYTAKQKKISILSIKPQIILNLSNDKGEVHYAVLCV